MIAGIRKQYLASIWGVSSAYIHMHPRPHFINPKGQFE